MSFFRYPGGKSRLRAVIVEHLSVYSEELGVEYREPFFGGGSVGLQFLRDNPYWESVWLNDKDIGIACLWTAVLRDPAGLCQLVHEFSPSVDEFYRIKHELSEATMPASQRDIVRVGFEKLAIHQISYSGLGLMSGGPLGGKTQESKYTIDCRWSPQNICRGVLDAHQLLCSTDVRGSGCSSVDFADLIIADGDALLYLDPPYYVKGNSLYSHGFTNSDHARLSSLLQACDNPWVLSYDDCEEIRALYDWACLEELRVNYTTGGKGSRSKTELLIYPIAHRELFHAYGGLL
jgi:DNA adenine methylase